LKLGRQIATEDDPWTGSFPRGHFLYERLTVSDGE
jgi:hypothetical protein